MTAHEAYGLLEKIPPFSLLGEDILRRIADEVVLEHYPRGKEILSQNGPAAEHLYILREGAVKVCVRTNEGEEVLIDHRSAGDFFGLLSFACGDVSRDTIVAVEDTSCYLLGKRTVLELLQTHAAFADFCFRSRLRRFQDLTYREIRDRTLLYGGGDKLLFTTVLGDLVSRQVVTAPEDSSIREAAQIMEQRGISSLVLVDGHGYPSGLVTDRDLRNKVVSRGRDPGGPVSGIMSITLIKAEARDYCFEALLKMMRYQVHHLLVVDNGQLKGIITNHDLMMLQGTSPLFLAREIEDQDTIDGLARTAGKMNKVITVLLREGARAAHITRIMTEINDRLVRKVLEVTERRLGPPPLAYCWIVFGSEGRKEQTFRTDQDNAIIHADEDGDGTGNEDYFSSFAAAVRDGLAACGFPPCSADYMASNPQWRQPLRIWKKYFRNWIAEPTPEAILRSLIFFDFRPVHGDLLLAERLRAFLNQAIRDNRSFLQHMAGTVLQNRPALGVFGQLAGERSGVHRGKINIKVHGLSPIVDLARLGALDAGVFETSTIGRLGRLKDREQAPDLSARDLEQAFELLLSLRIRHQFRQIEAGSEPDNHIDPRTLGRMDQRLLKEAFRLILSVQRTMLRRYGEGS